MPVCGRCFGLYASAPIGAALALAMPAWIGLLVPRRHELTMAFWRRVLIVGAIPTVLFGGAEWIGLTDPTSLARALVALPLGAAVALVVGAAIRSEVR